MKKRTTSLRNTTWLQLENSQMCFLIKVSHASVAGDSFQLRTKNDALILPSPLRCLSVLWRFIFRCAEKCLSCLRETWCSREEKSVSTVLDSQVPTRQGQPVPLEHKIQRHVGTDTWDRSCCAFHVCPGVFISSPWNPCPLMSENETKTRKKVQ